MRSLTNALRLTAVGLLALGLYAQSPQSPQTQKPQGSQGADRQQNETSMTGCLAKDAVGAGYTLADERTGAKTEVAGSADLAKHASHKVTLTGTTKMEGGKSVFQVSKIQHVAAECKAPAQ